MRRSDGLLELKFGFPTAVPLHDGTFLATWWSADASTGRTGVRWAKLRVEL